MTLGDFWHAVEFRRCLVDLDVPTARRLWAHVHPGWDQPDSDGEMLLLLHLARVRSRTIPSHLRAYSRCWLDEQVLDRATPAVGIATAHAHSEIPWLRRKSLAVREAMEDSVGRSIKAGIDIDHEAAEVKRRMLIARAKEWIGRNRYA